jgi:hypothetical protein
MSDGGGFGDARTLREPCSEHQTILRRKALRSPIGPSSRSSGRSSGRSPGIHESQAIKAGVPSGRVWRATHHFSTGFHNNSQITNDAKSCTRYSRQTLPPPDDYLIQSQSRYPRLRRARNNIDHVSTDTPRGCAAARRADDTTGAGPGTPGDRATIAVLCARSATPRHDIAVHPHIVKWAGADAGCHRSCASGLDAAPVRSAYERDRFAPCIAAPASREPS